MNNLNNLRKSITIAMLCAMAYAIAVLVRFPVVLFLKYEPKDIIITIGSFIYGPLTGVLMSFIIALIEMFTVSSTGLIGFIMNVIASCAFVCPAAYIYWKNKSLKYAAIGLIIGTISMTIAMLAWNYLITPLYLDTTRDVVVKMLIPTFLPFNLLKGGLNTAVILLIYKPVVTALRKSAIFPESNIQLVKSNTGIMLASGALLVTCLLFVLAFQGVI